MLYEYRQKQIVLNSKKTTLFFLPFTIVKV